MAIGSDSVWAIDIGSNSLKALRLAVGDGSVEVIGFDNIAHNKVLMPGAVPEVERDELTALTLRRFLERNDIGKDEIIISVPSQNSFARFVNLPPVEPKRIPEIVSFEAVQQIPFDITDVQWDWQLMNEADSAQQKVGIFAIKNEAVNYMLEHFTRENITVNYVQMIPMALYNYLLYDRSDLVKNDTRATVILNIGAENTDLVVCTKSTVWQRCIPMGGNAFTRAISEAFKINLEKSEKLKRTAPMSKYARQILQAMKPIFTDLASEIQRSLGFYSTSNPNTQLWRIIAFGGGTKMRGLLKYLQQSLQIPINRLDSFKKLQLGPDVSAAKFHESVCDFGVVYGLGLQALGFGRIESNLLPGSIARSMAWASKSRYFITAASLLLLVSLMCFGRVNLDRMNYARNSDVRETNSRIITVAENAINNLKKQKERAGESNAIISGAYEPFKYREVIPLLYQTIIANLPNEKNNPPQSKLYRAFEQGRVADVLKVDRKDRKQLFITSMSVRFVEDIGSASFDDVAVSRTRRPKRPKAGGTNIFSAEGLGDSLPDSLTAAPAKYAPAFAGTKPSRPQPPGTGPADDKAAGFVVIVEGYSPNKKIGELLDPVEVEEMPNKWGFITRLMHLDDFADGNSPFELYKKAEVEHFKLQTGAIDLNSKKADLPEGIGIKDFRFKKANRQAKDSLDRDNEAVLLDPMTKEIISRIKSLDKNGNVRTNRLGKVIYQTNDYWFTLKFKFIWRDAPAKQ